LHCHSQFGKPLSIIFCGAASWWAVEALVISQTLHEGRTVADLAENVGRWASQYGGVHARTVGTDARFPGRFLTRSVFALSQHDNAALSEALHRRLSTSKPP
jgi:hypothetical protein